MGARFKRFKLAFLSSSKKVEAYIQRKRVLQDHISSIKSMIYAWQDSDQGTITANGVDRDWEHFYEAIQALLPRLEESDLTLEKDLIGAHKQIESIIADARTLRSQCEACIKAGAVPDTVDQVIVKFNLAESVFKQILPDTEVSHPECNIEVVASLPIDKIEQFEADLLAYSQFSELVRAPYSAYYEECITLSEEYAAAAAEAAGGGREAERKRLAAASRLVKKLTSAEKTLVPDIQAAAEKALDAWPKRKALYSDYKMGARIMIATTATLAIAGFGTSLAASPLTFGASLIIGLWVATNNTIQMLDTIRSRFRSAEDALQGAIAQFESIEKSYRGVEGQLKGTGKELLHDGLVLLIGAPITTSIATASAAVNAASKKFIGIELDNHDLSAELPMLMDQALHLQKRCEAQLSDPSSAFAQAIAESGGAPLEHLNTLTSQLDTMLEQISGTQARIDAAQEWCVYAGGTLKDIKTKNTHDGAVTLTKRLARLSKIGIGAGVSVAEGALEEAPKTATLVLSTLSKLVGEVDKELATKMVKGG